MFIFRDVPPVNAIAELGEMIVSYDKDEDPISIEFLNASKRKLINPQNLHLTIASHWGEAQASKSGCLRL